MGTTETRAAIYCRISDDAEGDGDGVARQEADCRKRAKREDWRVIRIFTDNDVGASRHSKKKRPAYAELMERADRAELDVILAYSNSRLTRRPRELEDLIDLHERTGVRICTVVSGDDDLDTADGRMVARIKASVDAAESDRISERVRRQTAARIERGEWLGGPRPFGWNENGSLNEAEAEMIRAGAEHVLDGGPVGQLIRAWNAAGVTTARGARWRHVTVNRVLTRWRNCGVMEVAGKPRPEIATTWQPILSKEDVERLRAILSDPKRANAKGYAPRHLMAGIARCGREGCGAILKSGAVTSRGKRYAMYRCSGEHCGLAILIEVLDQAVTRHVIQAYAGAGPLPRRGDGAELAETNRMLAACLAERAQVEAAINDKLTTMRAMRPTLERLAEQEAGLRGEVERAYREDAHWAMVAEAEKVFTTDAAGRHRANLNAIPTMRARWDGMPLDQRRKLIRALFDVRVMPGRGEDRVVIAKRGDS